MKNIGWTRWLSSLPEFSFQYNGASSTSFLADWEYQQSSRILPEGRLEHHSWAEPGKDKPNGRLKVSLQVRHFAYFQAADWLLEFENIGSSPTPVLEKIWPLDASFPIPARERLRLHHANGSACRKDDFLPLITELPPRSLKTLAPIGGRSSNGTLPFLNLQHGTGGVVLGIGWSGQWTARFERSDDYFQATAGMERTHFRLEAGEKVRTPRILLLAWEGEDIERGQNDVRRLLLAHYLPRLDGQLVLPPVAQCLQGYFYLTGKAGEIYEMTALPKCAALGAEVYWIDACWYGGQGQWWEEVGSWEVNRERFPHGSWEVNRERFPHGLRPISDAARQAGMKFLLWFEPERARPASPLAREHPELFLSNPQDSSNLLLDLGNPAAREYLTEMISQRISELGVDIYRQDFNFDPLPYWQAADPPERIGISEIRYIEGLYTFWDELRHRHTGLWIDNCSSGGRRIDLETLSRSLPLWPSDFSDVGGLPYGMSLHIGDQCINAGLARWVPLFGGGVWNFTPYGTRSQIIGGFSFGYHIDHADFPAEDAPTVVTHNDVLARGKTLLDTDFPMEAARQAIEEWKSIRPYFTGNYYLLLPLTVSDHDWCAYQFHRPDLEAGVALAFRRHASPFPAMELNLKEIQPEAEYEVSLSPGYSPQPAQVLRGRDLSRLTLTIAEKPGSLLVRYRNKS